MYRRANIFLVVSQPSKSPHQQENIEPLSAGCTLPQSPHSCHPGQYHRRHCSKKCYIVVMITFYYYSVSYGKVKSAEEEDPSAETLSVVLIPEPRPPRSKTSPEGSDQQRCCRLSSTRLTGSGVKVPLLSNFTQDLSLPNPPQAIP